MSHPESSRGSIAAQLQEAIEAAQQSLREGEQFFEKFGLDREKVSAYLDSISTPEMQAQAQAAIEEDMRAIEQEARAQLSFTKSSATPPRTASRRHRNMI